MLVNIEAVAMPPRDGAHAVQLFAYSREETDADRRDDSVKSANHAWQIVESLCGKAERRSPGEAVILRGEPPRTAGHVPLWIVQLQVRNTHRGISTYRADYHKFIGCPNDCAEYMMEVYATIKHVLRGARNELRAYKAQLRAERESHRAARDRGAGAPFQAAQRTAHADAYTGTF